MGIISTSIVVNFGDTEQGMLKAEIDSRTDGFNNGETSFAPGEIVAFLVYSTPNVTVNNPVVSLGSTQEISSPITIAKEEFINFEDAKKGTPSFPIMSGFTYSWIGTSLGTVTVNSQREVSVATKGVAVLKINYNTQAIPWRLTNIPTSVNGITTFPVVVFISGNV